MKVLVTGATGFVGSHVVRQLLQAGVATRLLVRSKQKARLLFDDQSDISIELVTGSVCDPDAVGSALAGCDGVVHCAANTPMQGASDQEMLETNVGGVQTVFDLAVESGIERLVYLSSVTAIFHKNPKKISEEFPVASSRHAYGKSKAIAERYIRKLQDEGVPLKAVYPGGIAGPDDPGMSATTLSLLYRFTQGFRVTSGGTQQIDVRDLAALVVTLVTRSAPTPEKIIAVGHYLEWGEFANLLERISGHQLEKQEVPGWVLRLVGRFYDFKRLFVEVPLPVTAETMRYATRWPKLDNSPVLTELGVGLRPPEETFRDTLAWLADTGKIDWKMLPGLKDSEQG
jgi:nucleoside-diphosphate-sugar epimerase